MKGQRKPRRRIGTASSGAAAAVLFIITVTACGTPVSPPAAATDRPGVGATGSPSTTAGAEGYVPDRTVKVGAAVGLTGFLADASAAALQGMELALDEFREKGWEFAVFVEDTRADPTTGLRVVDKLINRDEVDFLVGPMSSGVAPALRDPVDESKTIMSIVSAAIRDLTGANCSRYIFRTTPTTYMHGIGFGPWLAENVGTKAYVIAADYAAGTEISDAIIEGFEEAGGEVVDYVRVPLATTDFAPYMPALLDSGADFVTGFLGGQLNVDAVRAFHQFGVKDKMTIAYHTLTPNELIDAQGAEATEGIIEYDNFSESLDTAELQDWAERLQAKFPDLERVNLYNLYGYTATKAVLLGIEDAESLDSDAVVDAMEELRFEGPAGAIEFNESHQAPNDYYITEVRDMKHIILETIPGVEDPNKSECQLN